jgi:hypothetical protein
MSKKKILGACFALLILATTIIFATQYRQSTVEKNLSIEVKLVNTITVTVNRANGEVETYVKHGDPWLRNFFALITNAFFGRYYVSAYSIYKVDGSTFTQPEWASIGGSTGYFPSVAIGVGTGSTSVTPYDYELTTLTQRIDVSSTYALRNDNGTHINMSFSASYTASSDITIREVGLYWKGYSIGSNTAFYVLMARDLITPINLAANDVLTATYSVSIPYSQAPMLKNLAALMTNYIFGMKSYSKSISFTTIGGTTTDAMDIGHDCGGGSYDIINEYVYVTIGSGDPIYRPTLSNLYSRVANSSSYVTISLNLNSTHAVISLGGVGVIVTNSYVIKEAGLLIKSTDIDASFNTNSQDVLLLYFPLSTPVSVPAGSGVKFTFTLAFPLAPSG